jgi:hypothetical protein
MPHPHRNGTTYASNAQPEVEPTVHAHYHYHHHNNPTPPAHKVKLVQELHPLDNGKNWIVGLSVAALLISLIVVAILAFMKSPTPPAQPVVTDTKEVAKPPVHKEEKVKEEKPAPTNVNKSSNNSGKSKNVTIEGNNNKVSQNTTINNTSNTTIVQQQQTVIVRERVVVVKEKTPPTVVVVRQKRDHCDDEAAYHELQVARWKTIFPAPRN